MTSLCDDHKDFYEYAPSIYEPSKESDESITKDLRLHVAAALLSLLLPLFASYRTPFYVIHKTLPQIRKAIVKKGEGYISCKIFPERHNSSENFYTRLLGFHSLRKL